MFGTLVLIALVAAGYVALKSLVESSEPGREPRPVVVGEATVTVESTRGGMHVKVVYPVAGGPRLVLYPLGGAMSVDLASLAAYPRELIGLGDLDGSYVLRTDEPERSRLLLAAAEASLAHRFAGAFIVGDRATLHLEVPQPVGVAPEDAVAATVELAGELGNADLFGLPALRRLAGSEEERAGDVLGVRVEVRGTRVHLAPAIRADGVGTRAWVEVDRGARYSLQLPVEDLAVVAEALSRPLAPEELALLARVGDALLIGSAERVALLWSSVEREVGRLAAAADLLAALARPPALGPYR